MLHRSLRRSESFSFSLLFSIFSFSPFLPFFLLYFLSFFDLCCTRRSSAEKFPSTAVLIICLCFFFFSRNSSHFALTHGMLHMSKNNIDRLAHKTEATLRPVAAIIVTYKFEREGRVQLVLSFRLLAQPSAQRDKNYLLRVKK